MRIREARPDEAPALSALVLRSKAHWGYDEAFLAACRDELTISAHEVTARRLAVAEDETSGEALGVASLEGRAPDGTLGLLFVEPRVIGLGIGRALYAHVLDRARELGFERLTIDSDPHAVDFYRTLGARPVPGGGALPRLLVEPPPRRAWVRAWTRGLRTVQLGNVGEFQAQFGEPTPLARRASGHYSCLAALGSPHPAAVVLPMTVPPGWVELLCRQLAWESVEVYDGLGAHHNDEAPPPGSPPRSSPAPPSPADCAGSSCRSCRGATRDRPVNCPGSPSRPGRCGTSPRARPTASSGGSPPRIPPSPCPFSGRWPTAARRPGCSSR